MVCADTSFLLSLAGNDSNSIAAVEHAQTLQEPICITALNRLEFENALRLLRFRGLIQGTEVAAAMATLGADESEGRIVEITCDWPVVLSEALRLSQTRAEQEGHRVLDILHVAAASKLNATAFLSFDLRQRALAAAEGLSVRP